MPVATVLASVAWQSRNQPQPASLRVDTGAK